MIAGIPGIMMLRTEAFCLPDYYNTGFNTMRMPQTGYLTECIITSLQSGGETACQSKKRLDVFLWGNKAAI